MSVKSKQKKYNREAAAELAQNGEIKFVPAAVAGVADAVELLVNGNVTVFGKEEGQVSGIEGMSTVQCKLMASYALGTVSISVRGEDPFMVTVRMDELMAVLHAASQRKIEFDKKIKKGAIKQ